MFYILHSVYLVAGNSLRKVLSSGVLDKMEKSIMLLVRKSASCVIEQARAETSHLNHSVSIELLDENGERAVEIARKQVVVKDDEIIPRKRPLGNGDRALENSS